MMPSLLNIHTCSDDAGEYYATNFVLGDRLDSYTESSHMLVGEGRTDWIVASRTKRASAVLSTSGSPSGALKPTIPPMGTVVAL